MIRKTILAYFLFFLIVLYIISPWFLEKRFLLNEIIAASGFLVLAYKKFHIGKDVISLCILFLLCWCGAHLVISLVRMDAVYYYLRNLVIVYSIFAYFIGFYLFKYLDGFVIGWRRILLAYTGILLLVPVSKFLFERFGMATLFPALLKKASSRLILPLLILINIIYSFTYDSATAVMITVFYVLIAMVPGYRFFKQSAIAALLAFGIFFALIQPNLSLIAARFSPYNDLGIIDVRNSNRLLALDPNSTWRLVLWKEVIVDHFPANLFGLGFGTPVMHYFPVEDQTKIASLPYILGAHNSYVYLFGRLGIVYILLTLIIYSHVFKEYFYNKQYYYRNKAVLVFYSFFAISVIALFNPTLETPIYATAYWLMLGFVAKAIQLRKQYYGTVMTAA